MKKYIFMVLILAIAAFGALAALSVSKVKAEDGKNLQQTERHKSKKNKKKKKDKEAEVEKEKWEKRFYLANYSHIPKEHREAVQKADIYANGCFFSRKRLIWEMYTMDRYSKEEIILCLHNHGIQRIYHSHKYHFILIRKLSSRRSPLCHIEFRAVHYLYHSALGGKKHLFTLQ